ncbi:MAG TPA: ankyrin repeat domain-containing protein, partial [Fibrobacteria bacterium]|nr:ankyrin repeat domain-containing protein [Fibrobacteria bacterium]
MLGQAIKHGSLPAAKVLVFMGAKVDAEDGAPVIKIPLQRAIIWCQQDLALFFLEKGASVHRKDSDGLTALARAGGEAEWSNFDKDFRLMKELLRLGADVNARDRYGNTILMHTCGRKIVEFLLRNGADPKARNNSGQSVLHSCYYTDALPLLLEHGVDASVRDSTGQTPLFEIMSGNNYGIREQILTNVELMIKAGLDPKARDKWGHRAIYYALEKGLDDYVAFLERHGAGEEMTPELAATLENELAGMLFRRMHALRRASGCEVTLRNGEQM